MSVSEVDPSFGAIPKTEVHEAVCVLTDAVRAGEWVVGPEGQVSGVEERCGAGESCRISRDGQINKEILQLSVISCLGNPAVSQQCQTTCSASCSEWEESS